MTRPIILDFQIGDCHLEAHGHEDPDDGLDIEKIFLLHAVPEDLSPNPNERRIERIDVTELVAELDVDWRVDSAIAAALKLKEHEL